MTYRFRAIGPGDDVLGYVEAPDPDTAWGLARDRWPWRVRRVEQVSSRRAA